MTQAVRMKIKWVFHLGCLAALSGCAQPISSDSIVQPSLQGVSPSSGSISGNTLITVTGAGFSLAATITVGGAPCLVSVATSTTTATCITPAGTTSGAVDVAILNRNLVSGEVLSASLVGAFTYTGSGGGTTLTTPTVVSVAPVSGSLNGGTAVTVTGTNFNYLTTATFGGRTCTDVVVTSSTTLTCTTPSQTSLGAVDVSATNHHTEDLSTASGTAVGAYTYTTPVATPTVTLVGPVSGSTNGNTTVTLTGTNFNSTTTVTFGGRVCTDVAASSATSLTCITPSQTSTGAVNVVATNHDAISLLTASGTMVNGYTYTSPLATPTFGTILPASGTQSGGTSVTITGTNFNLFTTVTIGGSTCRDVVVGSATSLTCNTPTSATAAARDVVISNHDPISLAIASVTGTGAYTYTAPSFTPVVTDINPEEGPMAGGTVVTVTGSNFNLGSLVSIGGQNCGGLVILSTTSITCTTASVGAGATVDVVVTNRDLETGLTYPGTLASAYTYNPPPTFSSASQGFFMGGTTITVTGTGFRSGATVTINSIACTGVNVSDSMTLTCVAPAGAALTSTNIVITNVDSQTVTGVSGFTWRQAAFGTFVDGNGTDGLGEDLTKNGSKPRFTTFSSKLLFTSQESNGTADNIRVFRFNGSDTAPVWEQLDGGGTDGLNNDPTKAAANAMPVVLASDLWVVWEEINGSAVSTIRAQRYNGDGSAPPFSSMDGGGLNRDSSRQATAPTAAAGTNLFVAFLEEDSSINTQIRVKKWNGSAWSNFDTVSAENGLNVNPSKNALAPSMQTLGGRIYLAFQETSNTSKETIQVMCNEDETTEAWSDITGTGLNRDLTHHARNPRMLVYNNKIYLTWVEESAGTIPQVRVARFDGASCADQTWVFVDGNAQNVGINKDPTRQAQNPSLGVLDTYLYAIWTESNGVAQNTRAAVLSNEGAGTWTFIDGNGFNGINKDTSRIAANGHLQQFNSKLYGVWSESNGTNTTIRVNVAK